MKHKLFYIIFFLLPLLAFSQITPVQIDACKGVATGQDSYSITITCNAFPASPYQMQKICVTYTVTNTGASTLKVNNMTAYGITLNGAALSGGDIIANQPVIMIYDIIASKWCLIKSGSGAGGGGTVTNVVTGTGLTGGPITTTGTIAISTVPVANGGTNITSYTTGDMLYASGSTTLSKLTDVSVNSFLRSGGVSTAPAWSTTKWPNAVTTNYLLYGTATNTVGTNASLQFDGTTFTVPVASTQTVLAQQINDASDVLFCDVNNKNFYSSAGNVILDLGTARLITPALENTWAAVGSGTTSATSSFRVLDGIGSEWMTFSDNKRLTYRDGNEGASKVLTSDANGVATWQTASGGAPGGSTTQVQYNNAGSFSGITGATTNGTALTLVGPILGTPASGTLTNCTLPIGGLTGLGTGISPWLVTPSSTNLAAAVTGETGSGTLVFGTAPALVAPTVTGTGTTASTYSMRIQNSNSNNAFNIHDNGSILMGTDSLHPYGSDVNGANGYYEDFHFQQRLDSNGRVQSAFLNTSSGANASTNFLIGNVNRAQYWEMLCVPGTNTISTTLQKSSAWDVTGSGLVNGKNFYADNGKLHFGVDPTDKLTGLADLVINCYTCTCSGCIGIGTTTPLTQLEINTTAVSGYIPSGTLFNMASATGTNGFACFGGNTSGDHSLKIGVTSTGYNNIQGISRTDGTARDLHFQLDGGTFNNVLLGGTAARAGTRGTFNLCIFDGTAPTSTLANGISLYSSSGNLWCMDAAGIATRLSTPHTISTPTTTANVTLVNNQFNAVDPAGTIAALTLTFPASPANNDFVKVKFSQIVTTITYVSGTGGATIKGQANGTLGGYIEWRYDLANNTWY